jgi:hypothetical protein
MTTTVYNYIHTYIHSKLLFTQKEGPLKDCAGVANIFVSVTKRTKANTKQRAVGQNLVSGTPQRRRITADRTGAQWHGPVARHPDTEIVISLLSRQNLFSHTALEMYGTAKPETPLAPSKSKHSTL